MSLSVPLAGGGIFDFAEMRGFLPFGLYLRETAQRVRSSASRYSVNRMRITEKQFAVWRLLQNMPAKSLRFLAVLVVPKMGTTTLGREDRLQYMREQGQMLRTYVQRFSPATLPVRLSVRTYAANHRKTPIYSDAPVPRSRKSPVPGDRRRWSHCCSIRDCTCPGWQSQHR